MARVENSKISQDEMSEPGTIKKLRSLFGDTAPVKRNYSINKKTVVMKQNGGELHQSNGGIVEETKKEVAKEMIKDQIGEGVIVEKIVTEKVGGKVIEQSVMEKKEQVFKEIVTEKKTKVKRERKHTREEHREEVQEQVIDFVVEMKVDEVAAEKVIKREIEDKVEQKIEEKVKDKIEEKVKDKIEERIKDKKEEQIKNKIEEKVEEKIKEEIKDRIQGDEDKKKPAKKSKKKVLIVYAHVFKESFEGCLVGAATKAFKDMGAEVQISNLFEMGFNPIASPKDFGGKVSDKEFYSYSLLAGQAKTKGQLAQDVVAEQDKVDWADTVVIVSQLQSHGLPALLKGWFDRIMTYNFAFSDGKLYEQGRLKGKRALVCLTTEALSSMYTPRGLHGDINIYLWPLLNGVLRFAGFDVLKPQVYFGAGRASGEYREKSIQALIKRLEAISDEKPLSFIPTERFTETNGFRLTDADVSQLEKAKLLTVGQHAGKSVQLELAYVVEPEKRVEEVKKKAVIAKDDTKEITIEIKKETKEETKGERRPWYTYWD